jgi:uncharacterized membrane protein
MLPDWLPNIHPLIIHFPIALLVFAVLFDLARLRFREQDWLENAVIALYASGTIGLIAAFFTGREAVETVSVTGGAVPVVSSHEDWALYTLIFFMVYTTIRFMAWWKEPDNGFVQSILLIIAFVGIGILWKTGDLGAQLVYQHGVAVGEVDRLSQQIEELEQRLSVFRNDAGPEIREDGSWSWRIGAGADQALLDAFTITGAEILATTDKDEERTHLVLTAPDDLTFMLMEGNIASVDGRAEINMREFEGDFLLIHHFRDIENYQYIRITGRELEQGQVVSGSDTILGSGQVETGGWTSFRVTSSGAHYYAYQDQATIVHTHKDELDPGKTGMALKGTGVVNIRFVEFKSL